MRKTYYGVYLDCVGGLIAFETSEEAEKFRKLEIENSNLPMGQDDISDVLEVKMTEEEFKNRIEI